MWNDMSFCGGENKVLMHMDHYETLQKKLKHICENVNLDYLYRLYSQ